jgi:predicted DNA-binding transcriptional regulator YafY
MKDLIDHTLRIAAASDLPVNIIYQENGEITQRVIEIQSLTDTGVVAYCRKSRQIRTFERAFILAAQITDSKIKWFTPHIFGY